MNPSERIPILNNPEHPFQKPSMQSEIPDPLASIRLKYADIFQRLHNSTTEPEKSTEQRFLLPYDKIVSDYDAVKQVQIWKEQGLSVVIADAVADIPHYRHADYLLKCANLGDRLVIRVESDELVASRKDPRGPIVSWERRVKHIAHYPYIDLVAIQYLHGLEYLLEYKPDIVVKSTTSGRSILDQIDELKSDPDKYSSKLVVFDQYANRISLELALIEGVAYDQDRLGDDKFSGTIIKNAIIKRAMEDLDQSN